VAVTSLCADLRVDATIINIGNASSIVNFNGTVNDNNVTNLVVSDQLITLNAGGGVGSATGAGIEFEEDSVITGYVKTSADRNSLTAKAPATAGVVIITPGTTGFTIDQGSHDPATVTTTNGLSILGQEISLQAATAAQNGALTSTDWTTFNNKANLALSNLTATSINQSLVPALDITSNLGANLFAWSNVYANFLRRNNTSPSILLQNGTLNDASNITVGNWDQGILISNSTNSLNWKNRQLINGAGAVVANWGSNTLVSGADSLNSINWSNRTLVNSTGTMLNWNGTEVSFANKRVIDIVDPTGLQDAATKKYVDDSVLLPTNADINAGSFIGTTNGATNANITGLVHPNNVMAFKGYIRFYANATGSPTDLFELSAVRSGNTGLWSMSYSSTDGSTGAVLDIDPTTGQVIYSIPTYGTFINVQLKFRTVTVIA